MPFTLGIVIVVSVVSLFSFFAYMVKVKAEASAKMHDVDNKQADELAELKLRVEVLEKIITDDGYDLKKEIDALKKTG